MTGRDRADTGSVIAQAAVATRGAGGGSGDPGTDMAMAQTVPEGTPMSQSARGGMPQGASGAMPQPMPSAVSLHVSPAVAATVAPGMPSAVAPRWMGAGQAGAAAEPEEDQDQRPGQPRGSAPSGPLRFPFGKTRPTRMHHTIPHKGPLSRIWRIKLLPAIEQASNLASRDRSPSQKSHENEGINHRPGPRRHAQGRQALPRNPNDATKVWTAVAPSQIVRFVRVLDLPVGWVDLRRGP